MSEQRTRTKQLRLRAPLTTTLGIRKVCSAISTYVRSITDWIIIIDNGGYHDDIIHIIDSPQNQDCPLL